jgi:hypothetical protein
LADALLRRLHAGVLMRARHLLLPAVEDDEVADQVEQPALSHICASGGRAARPREWRARCPAPRPSTRRRTARRARGAVAQALRVAARQHQLHRAEEALVEDLSWLVMSWRTPSATSTELRLSSITTTAMPLM